MRGASSLRGQSRKFIKEMPAGTIAVPDDLNARVRDYLDENPKSPWEEAVARLAEAGQ